MRLALAALFLVVGFPGVAMVVAVLAVISLFASVESQVARVIAEAATPAGDEEGGNLTERQKAVIERQRQAIQTLNDRNVILKTEIWQRRELYGP